MKDTCTYCVVKFKDKNFIYCPFCGNPLEEARLYE